MRKILSPFLLVFLAFLLLLQIFTFAQAQDLDVTIKIDTDKAVLAKIQGAVLKKAKNPRNLSILNDYAGTSGLAERITNVRLTDADGKPIEFKRFNASEHVGERDIAGFQYDIALIPMPDSTAAAHVSWIRGSVGILTLDDLLPQSIGKSANVRLELPKGWNATSTDRQVPLEPGSSVRRNEQEFMIADIEKAIIFIGSDDRLNTISAGKTRILFDQRGEWLFDTKEGLQVAAEIFSAYEHIFGFVPAGDIVIGMTKFPTQTSPGIWEADTRGRTVNLVSSDMPFKSQSLQRLHEQLRHELFHIWMPNGVSLSGNYDWFYEGFALYQSLRSGVSVGRIRFEDYLDTLSRAYEIDSFESKRLSLVDASKNRWSGSNTKVYARGMLVAFICDLSLLENSKGKVSVADLLREIFQKHRPPAAAVDGNLAVIDVMQSHRELVPIIDRYITGAERLDWAAYLTAAGIQSVSDGHMTKLTVGAKPTGRQKDLLDKLGYNNWRKSK